MGSVTLRAVAQQVKNERAGGFSRWAGSCFFVTVIIVLAVTHVNLLIRVERLERTLALERAVRPGMTRAAVEERIGPAAGALNHGAGDLIVVRDTDSAPASYESWDGSPWLNGDFSIVYDENDTVRAIVWPHDPLSRYSVPDE